MNRTLVTNQAPESLEQFAAGLRERVGDLKDLFEIFLQQFLEGRAGDDIARLTDGLFDLWAQKSYLVKQVLVLNRLHSLVTAKRRDLHPEIRSALVKEFFFPPSVATNVADSLLSLLRGGATTDSALRKAMWACYEDPRRRFCVQSAHVFLARLLLQRVGEDMGFLPLRVSGPRLENELRGSGRPLDDSSRAALALVHEVRNKNEGLFPAIYDPSEFDWWWVPHDKRHVLDDQSVSVLEELERQLELLSRRLLRWLNGFQLSEIDADIWRSVYESYLPTDERQQLGGFYTPPELVDLVLDLAGYQPNRLGLCEEPFVDPASGSGSFVVHALTRLLQHLESDLPCHAALNARQAPWKRSELVLRSVQDNLHAIDLHPFAAFLTTANTIFLLLPHFVPVRLKNPKFGLGLAIFATDSLIKHRTELDWEAFDRLNARIQLTVHSFDRYEQMLKLPFAFVFGNPPWGGVLKGPLSPIFDEHKKKHFRKAFPTAAVGKYDIYGLFFARGLEFLRPGGVLALLTQNTYLEKEWATELRRQLATRTNVQHIVDLGPYGHLYFHAMNTPCITTTSLTSPDTQSAIQVAVAKKARLPRLPEHARRAIVVDSVRSQMAALAAGKHLAEGEFCEAFAIPRSRLVPSNGNRWDLAPPGKLVVSARPGLPLTETLEPRQGVTPGGALDIFLITNETAKHANLEDELVYRAFKTREIDRWWIQWRDRCLVYPYTVKGGKLIPAFKSDKIAQTSLSRFQDALDFSVAIDDSERALLSSAVELRERVEKILEHRVALGVVDYPHVASFLVSHYPELEQRIFKKKRLEAFGRNWYEYLWPRDASLLITPRLVCPRLMREVRFALETEGYLSDDACVFLLPTAEKAPGFEKLREALTHALRTDATKLEVLHYVLGFLNTGYVQGLLTYGRRPTPKGFYAVNEQFLSEILIPLPAKPAPTRLLIDAVAKLCAWVPDLMERRKLEDQVERLARELLSP